MNQERDFKGIWIPKNVWLDNRLNALDKIILMEIDSLDFEEKGCYASNEYIAEFCQCSERKVSEAISKLIEFNYIYLESFNGRTRVLRSTLSNCAKQTSKNCEAEKQKNLPIKIDDNTNIDNKESIINNTKEKEKILRIFTWWNVKNIIKHSKLNETRIKAIKNKLKDYNVSEIEKAISNYATVLHDNSYYWNYTWSLEDFLNRKNGFTTFLDEGSNWVNYQKQKGEISRETAYPEFDDVGYIR